jgi:predicted nucleic-acid-binding protein
VISLDTNVLARFYVDDPTDKESVKQRPLAAKLLTSDESLFVTLGVVFELAWLVRAQYEFSNDDVANMLEHLSGMRHVSIERWDDVQSAIEWMRSGLEFADALHLACSANCNQFATFDDRGFARKAAKLGVSPPVRVLR